MQTCLNPRCDRGLKCFENTRLNAALSAPPRIGEKPAAAWFTHNGRPGVNAGAARLRMAFFPSDAVCCGRNYSFCAITFARNAGPATAVRSSRASQR